MWGYRRFDTSTTGQGRGSARRLGFGFPQKFICLALALWAVTGRLPCQAAFQTGEAPANEYQVKAAFIYNFPQFVDWPRSAFPLEDSPIVIGLLGSDPLDAEIERALVHKTVRGRAIVVRRLESDASVKECHMIYIGSSEARKLNRLLELTKDAPVLTIGDSSGFAERGGIVNLVLEKGRVGIEVNLNAAKQAGLTISSRMLNLARIVQ